MPAVKNVGEPCAGEPHARFEVAAGTGEALPGPASAEACRRSDASYNRLFPGSGWCAGWASEAAVVPLEPAGQQNPGRGKGRYFVRASRRRLALITADDVVAVMRQLQADGLSPWTVKRILGALSCVFTFALRRGYVATHPFHRLERDERPQPLRSDQRVLTCTELARLFAACPPRYRPLLLTGAYTGMRLSEVLGLSWGDIDFADGSIHVRHQLARGRGGVPPHRIPPKTRASVREIPLLPQLAAVLRLHKRRSHFTAESDYVFATAHGTPFLHHNVSKRVLRRAATGAGLDRPDRRVRFHDLRHTFASHLIIDIRLDVAQVSAILGHARTSMTLDTYTHLFEETRHGADIRAELAKSDFANLLELAIRPRLRAGEHLRSTRAAAPRRRRNTAAKRRCCAPHSPPLLLDQDLTNEIRQQLRQRI